MPLFIAEACDYKQHVHVADVRQVLEEFCDQPFKRGCQPEMYDTASNFVEEHLITSPTTAEDAKQLYLRLVREMTQVAD